jgi:hypothetical protein
VHDGCVLCVAAIQALVSLNEQISTSLALPDGAEEPDFERPSPRRLQDGGSVACRQQQALDSSMALMRRLLVDAQVTTFCSLAPFSEATYSKRLGFPTKPLPAYKLSFGNCDDGNPFE